MNLDSASEEIRTALERVVAETAQAVVEKARSRLTSGSGPSAPGASPADPTGNLAASITCSSSGANAEASVGAPYAVFLELGTAKMAARPFLLPAAVEVFADVERRFK